MNTFSMFGNECAFVNATYYDDADIQTMLTNLQALVHEIAGTTNLACLVNEVTVSYCSGEYKSRVDTLSDDDDDQSFNLFLARKQTLFGSELEQISGLGAPDSRVPPKFSSLLAHQVLEVMLSVTDQPSHGMHLRMLELVGMEPDKKRYFSFPHAAADQLIASRLGDVHIGIHSRAKKGSARDGKLISARRRITRLEHRLYVNRLDQQRMQESLEAVTDEIEKREARLAKLQATVAALSAAKEEVEGDNA